MVKRLVTYPLLAVFVVVALWAIADSVTWRPEPLTQEEVFYNAISEPTVKVIIKNEENEGWGSGVIVAREGRVYFVCTAKHVIKQENAEFYIQNPNTYGRIPAQLFRAHPTKDIAIIIFVSERKFPIAKLASITPIPTTPVYLCGYGRRGILNNGGIYPKNTHGILSAKDSEWIDAPGLWIITAQIWYGDSGCGAWNNKGQLIGIAIRGKRSGPHLLSWQCGIISLDDVKEFLKEFGFGLAKDAASSIIKHEDEAGYFYPVRLWPQEAK